MGKIISLMYHDAYCKDKSESGFKLAGADIYKIKPEVFEHQLQQIEQYMEINALSKDQVRFTFDDGGVSFYTILAPLLEKYGYKGYFFISTQFIGTDGFMTEEQIKELENRGHVIGGHSETHRQRMNDLSYEDVLEDWRKCSDKLQTILGHKITCCSLPCGYMSINMMKALKALGYTDIYTSEANEMVREVDSMKLYGRYGVREAMTDEYVVSIVTNPKVRLKIKARKAVLNMVKNILGGTYVTIREKIFKKD